MNGRAVTVKDSLAIAKAVADRTGLEVDVADVFQIVRLVQMGHGSDAGRVFGGDVCEAVVSEMPRELIPPPEVAGSEPESLVFVVSDPGEVGS